jgi:chromosome segregation ATPase
VTTVTFRKLAVLTLATGIMLGASSPNAHARKIVCWKNHENVRECGNSVPPEFAQKSIERKSKMGMTLEKTERAKTQEELAASREERTRLRKEKAENDRLATEQARKDRVLLQTFTTEEDLQLASKGKVAAIDSRVKHSEQLVTKLEGTRDDIQNEAAQIERGGKKVLEALAKKFNDVQVQIDSTQGQIEQRNKERIQVQEQFESDLVRYRELKGS